ncbi:MAG: RNA 2',3'-cyclic phosphodiesterase [Candidatus Hydrogenedens sp.]|jgi:2'-5' RNA ligase|nr:RNA 2',3'-cyclic phosphodiesterase [Candidatus Hydrogenedens sp.]
MTDRTSEEKTVRLFAAIALPSSVQESVAAYVEECRNAVPTSIRWVDPKNLHITLRFYGELQAEQALLLQSSLDHSLSGLTGPLLQLAGTGAFPSLRRPSIFWAGVKILSGDLMPLVEACEEAAHRLDQPAEAKRFVPHITLGRLRKKKEFSHREREVFGSRTPSHFGQEFKAQNVVLFKSQLTPRGPVYTPLKEYPLL